jgi:hypothetical protein
MDEKVAKLNIEHYKRLLASETAKTKRQSIAGLLAEEETNLAKIPKERRWRQCVGCTSIHFPNSAFIQPPGTQRQGKTSGCVSSLSMTASSRSRSYGEVDIGCHMRLYAPLEWPAI